LGAAGPRFAQSLRAGDLTAARQALRSLVSRDTSRLPPSLLAAAAIESVAENASDSVIAPLGFFLLLGVPGRSPIARQPRSDAMIGYHGETECWARRRRGSTTSST